MMTEQTKAQAQEDRPMDLGLRAILVAAGKRYRRQAADRLGMSHDEFAEYASGRRPVTEALESAIYVAYLKVRDAANRRRRETYLQMIDRLTREHKRADACWERLIRQEQKKVPTPTPGTGTE